MTLFAEQLKLITQPVTTDLILEAIQKTFPAPSPPEVYAALQTVRDYFGVMMTSDLAQFMGDVVAFYQSRTVFNLHCGPGQLLAACPASTAKSGMDKNPTFLAVAEALLPDVTFHQGDPLTNTPDEIFDAVITHLPFGVRVQHDGSKQPLERLLLNKALSMLNNDGVLVALAPGSLLTTGFFELFRRTVIEQFALDMIVTLPVGILPKLNIETCVLVIRNGTPHPTTYFAIWETGPAQLLANLQTQSGAFHVAREAIQNRWDRHFYNPRFTKIDEALAQLDTRPLSDVGNVFRGYPADKSDVVVDGEYQLLTPKQINAPSIAEAPPAKLIRHQNNDTFQKMIVQPGDVLVSLLLNAPVYQVQPTDPPAVAGPMLAVIRSDQSGYISAYLQSPAGLARFQAQVERRTAGGVLRRLSLRDLRQIRIPLLPLEDLNRLSDTQIAQASAAELTNLKSDLVKVQTQVRLQETETASGEDRELLAQVLTFFGARFNKIDHALHTLTQKTDAIWSALGKMQGEIQSIKETPRSEDEKIARIYQQLDLLIAQQSDQVKTEADYQPLVTQWLPNWEQLAARSMTYLVSAEFLMDEIYRAEGADYSPFVLQYCRALESELLEKVCVAYHVDVWQRYGDPEPLMGEDYWDRRSKVNRFARAVKQDRRTYALGEIVFNLKLLTPSGRSFQQSPLLQDFRGFVLTHFDPAVLSGAYLAQIDQIVRDYRNKAAHPHLLNLATAQACQAAVRDCLGEFLGFKKSGD